MRKYFAPFIILIIPCLVCASEEIQVNKKVIGENWDFTVISVQNTGKNLWARSSGLSQEGYYKLKDPSQCFWIAKIKVEYKGQSVEKSEFKTAWTALLLYDKRQPGNQVQQTNGMAFRSQIGILYGNGKFCYYL